MSFRHWAFPIIDVSRGCLARHPQSFISFPNCLGPDDIESEIVVAVD